jgi:alginate O-acetyltransferase complex protein AlgI
MLFYKWDFIVPFIVMYLVYIRVGRRAQNILILVAGYAFYGMWNWRFLPLLVITTAFDYTAGRLLHKFDADPFKRRLCLIVSMAVNLGMLGYFKYANFFLESMASILPFDASSPLVKVVLPAGISFYTFQSMSYVIDVFKRHIPAEKNLLDFAAFVSYFPHLVAGPIQRAEVLLAQITRKRTLSLIEFFAGCRLFMVGLFKKLVVGDNVASFVDPVFDAPQNFDAVSLLVAAYGFAVHIYCDFSGYTDMARGISQMMGIHLTLNFNFPYFATGFRDFWKRWHISLSSWFRDYVYIPIGGNRVSEARTITNLYVSFLLSGLWHGAGWPYILWGAYHGTLVAAEHVLHNHPVGRYVSRLPESLKMVLTFHAVVLGWILFRSSSLAAFGVYLASLTHCSSLPAPIFPSAPVGILFKLVLFAGPLFAWEYIERRAVGAASKGKKGPVLQGAFYGAMLFFILLLRAPNGKQFIYFQF